MTPDPWHIRPARGDEARCLAEIAWAAKAFWDYPPAQLEAWREALSPSVASIADNPTLVAMVDEAQAAFCQVRLGADAATLEHLWVHPQYVGKGLGRALLAHAMRHLATLGIERLDIDADPHAEGFYRRCGAIKWGVIPAPIAGQPDRVRPQMRLATGVGPCLVSTVSATSG